MSTSKNRAPRTSAVFQWGELRGPTPPTTPPPRALGVVGHLRPVSQLLHAERPGRRALQWTGIVELARESSAGHRARLAVRALAVELHHFPQRLRSIVAPGLQNVRNGPLKRLKQALAGGFLTHELGGHLENEVKSLRGIDENACADPVTVWLSDCCHEREQRPWVQVVSTKAIAIHNNIEVLGAITHTLHSCLKDTGVMLRDVLHVGRRDMPEAGVYDRVAAVRPCQNTEIRLPFWDPRSKEDVVILFPPLQRLGQDLGSSRLVPMPALQVNVHSLIRAPGTLPISHLATWQKLFRCPDDCICVWTRRVGLG
mmetsp:Transcript_100814/g.284341  ORF Transcript_100814/g.284341 Transcript_100814/m.284341 type:complete len:313 (+) Transcript_100814:256-1194(+)